MVADCSSTVLTQLKELSGALRFNQRGTAEEWKLPGLPIPALPTDGS